jgi:hypothetical protein
MPQLGFEIMIPVFERAKTVHVLDRKVNVIGQCFSHLPFASSKGNVPAVRPSQSWRAAVNVNNMDFNSKYLRLLLCCSSI